MEPWVLPLAISIIAGLIGAIYLSSRARDDRQDETMREHISEDVKAHERLKAVETKVDALEAEVRTLRERWHDLRTEVSHTLAEWFNSVMDQVRKRDK